MLEVKQRIHERFDAWQGFRSHMFRTLMDDDKMLHFHYSSDRQENLGQDLYYIESRLKIFARLVGVSHDPSMMKQLRKYMDNIFTLPSGKTYEIKGYRKI